MWWNIASNGYFTFQMIIGAYGTISDVVCVGSPVIIIIHRKVNKQVHRKIWNFQTRVGTIVSTETSWSSARY